MGYTGTLVVYHDIGGFCSVFWPHNTGWSRLLCIHSLGFNQTAAILTLYIAISLHDLRSY